MNDLETAVAVLGAIWMCVLTISVLVLLRETSINSLRLNAVFSPAPAPGDLAIGAEIPDELAELLPATDEEQYAIWFSSACLSCSQVLNDLTEHWTDKEFGPLHGHAMVLLTGEDLRADRLAADAERVVPVVRDPTATKIVQQLELPGTPFAVAVRNSKVAGWAVLHSIDDLMTLHAGNLVAQRADAEVVQ